MTPNPTGLVFGKYEIQHRLAIGGMGEVFYSLQRGVPGFERAVILKSLLPDLAQQKDFIDQFLDEARVAATLNHPNVVSIFEVGLWNGTYFIAMEYIRGRNLAQLLRRCVEQQSQVPTVVAARIIADAALGLDHAHRATTAAGEALSIVHRDISPQNIMVRDDGVTKVVDFGIARASNRSTRTATGTVKGKLAYMAPEQVHGGSITAAVDQYALGVCFWELLTQRRLFKADSDLELLKLVVSGTIPAPSSLREGVDAELDGLVLRMLAARPEDRFESCAQVAAQLADYLTTRSPPGGVQPASFMRRLGTADLVLHASQTPQTASPNFVISLEQPALQPTAALPLVDPQPATVAGRPLRQPSRRGALIAGAVALFGLAAAGLFAALRGERADQPPVQPIIPLETAPFVEAQPEPDTGPPEALAQAHFVISSSPAGAAVRMDGKPIGTTPLALDAAPSVVHYLSFEKTGFQRLELEVPAVEPDMVKEVPAKLLALPSARIAPPTPLPASNEPGFLSLDTRPWTKVNIDGDPAGSTPLFKKRLTPGKHTLTFVNEGASIRTTRVVNIEPEKTLKLSLKLDP